MIDWLQNWFEGQCDGSWEHEYSIRIETIDNPGWNIEIDLPSEMNNIVASQEWKLFELSDDNWIGYKIENNIFSASGDSKKLNLMLLIFKNFIENKNFDDTIITDNMKDSRED
jgi:hypothetical protein